MIKNIVKSCLITLTIHYNVVYSMHTKLSILIGPSGVGKTTLVKRLQQQNIPLEYLITYTTRMIRTGEVHGKDYYFLSQQEFEQKKEKNEFISINNIYGNWYGIDKNSITSKEKTNFYRVACLTGDTAQELKNFSPHAIKTIFIMPPSLEILEQRLIARSSETKYSLEKRLASATTEIKQSNNFDFTIINNDLDTATERLKKIILQSNY